LTKYRIEWRAAAKRAVAQELPEKYALAVYEFITGPLSENPKRVGKELGENMKGQYSARLSVYRVIYEIHDDEVVVIVVDVRHRAHVYAARIRKS
jgi:mRNA-degrading endonuclease RelE of RelBE toxin-antitoxin system